MQINVSNISVEYDGTPVIYQADFVIHENEKIALIGRNGCGKTTLLKVLTGEVEYQKGEDDAPYGIFTSGNPVIGFLKQTSNDDKAKTMFDEILDAYSSLIKIEKDMESALEDLQKDSCDQNVRRYSRLCEQFEREGGYTYKKEYLTAVKKFGFSNEDMQKPLCEFSGGQRTKISLLKLLLSKPDVLLLDEPLGALDLKMRKEMQLELKAIHRNVGITFVYVTHDQEEALTMSDKIVVVNDGVIQQIGTPKKIYDEPSNAFVADFIGESNILSGLMVKDFKVCFLDTLFDCEDKGFAKNEPVDLVIRPEDITIYRDGVSGQLGGKVVSSVFKGTWYEMEIECNGYEFTVQSTVEAKPGDEVRLGVTPDGIHIMKKLRTVNTFKGEVEDESTVRFCGGSFEVGTHGLQKGDTVNVSVPFDAVELTDDEEDGVIGANVTQILYKGTYYQVQIYTDTDEDFYIDTTDEWDIDDRVGVKVLADKIKVEKTEETEDEEV